MEKSRIMINPVDVICYGQKKHFDTRKKAIDFFLDCMNSSEGAERERYVHIYLELLNTDSPLVSDGEPEFKEKRKIETYNAKDKKKILSLIAKNKLSISSPEIYDIRNCKLVFEDRDIVKALLEQKGWYAAQFLRKYIENDKELIMTAQLGGKGEGHALAYASDVLRSDREFVLKMVRVGGENFRYASEELRNDIEVVSAALDNVRDESDLKMIKLNIGNELLLSMVSTEKTIMKDNGFEWTEDMIGEVEQLNDSTPEGQIIDADTILADLVQDTDFEITGIAQDIFNIWKNSTDKKAVEQMFYEFTDMEFDRYLMKCKREITTPEQSLDEKLSSAGSVSVDRNKHEQERKDSLENTNERIEDIIK